MGARRLPGADAPSWVWLQSGEAQLVVAKASQPVVPHQQAVLFFYVYTEDAPGGELRLTDPDRYVLMVTHV